MKSSNCRFSLWLQDNFATWPPSSNLLSTRPRQITSFPWDFLSKINQSIKGGLCSRRSLIPSPQSPIFLPRSCSPSPSQFTLATQATIHAILYRQPRPQDLLLVQNGGRRTPGQGRLLKYSKNRGVFCHVTHDEMAFSKGSFQRLAALFIFCNRKPWSKRNEVISSCLRDAILKNFWSHFSSLGQGFLRPPF